MAENDKNNIFPLSGLLLLLAALGFLQFSDMPFVGSRPDVSDIRDPAEKPKARLWQEPFRAVLDYHAKAGDSAANEAAGIGNSLQAQIGRRAGKGRVTILGVMVFGAPYAEETEDRLRRRYAVLTGLGQRDYVPDDPEHLDFLRIDNGSAAISMSNIMPFEWFSRTSDDAAGNRDSVLVLWINDDVFAGAPLPGAPLANLGWLADRLGLQQGGKFKDNINLKIIGPAGSTSLQRMVAELGTFDERLAGLEIYSATATMDDSLLLATLGGAKAGERTSADSPEKQVISKFAEKKITFTRTIASDRMLAEKLLTELELRRVAADRDNGYIMLVAEWDTLYARSLLRIYEQVFAEKGIAGDRLIHFSYMRGIDGSLPGQKEEKKNDTPESGEGDGTKVKHLERPIGESQYDYLRRLAGEAYEIERLQLEPKKGSIRAIGVLGSDFYDKYLVLQALRQKFPDVIFFTTDLDARLLHPDNSKWTRNLVVASSYGLKWQEKEAAVQKTAAPPKKIPLSFRSNYQSSIFAATLQALATAMPEHPGNIQYIKEPRIFEIGRHSAVELSGATSPAAAAAGDANATLGFGAKIVAIALAIFLLLYFSSHTVKTAIKATISGRRYPALALAAGLLVFIGWLFYLIHLPGEEPFSWDEGVSIWPTEILRLTAVFLSFFFLLYSSAGLKKNRLKIAGDFGLAAAGEVSPGKDQAGGNGLRPRVTGVVNRFCDTVNYNWDAQREGKVANMADLWNAYLRRDSLGYRLIRLAPIIFLYMVLCLLIFLTFGKPVTPVRGALSWGADKIALLLSVVFFIVLNFYVFDVTRTFRRFIILAGKLPQWPRGSVRRFCGKDDIQEDEALQDWMLIRLIAIRTEALGKLIFYPFSIWLILFMARINYFDNWHLPIGLGIILTLGALYAWSSAFVLRRSAERARAAAIQRLTKQLAGTLADKTEGQSLASQIEFALSEVRSSRQGAFAPFTQHPVLQALLIPFGGVGGIYLFDLLAKLNI
ncbi:MAG: hypothetical protein M0P70_10950 [Desulfobulbaceae bacterium]|nr:hypothetical protein [Desulfobulbaceae bacterium]